MEADRLTEHSAAAAAAQAQICGPVGAAAPGGGDPREIASAATQHQQEHWIGAWHRRWCGAHQPTHMFAETLYLSFNSDVQELVQTRSIRSGAEHWVRIGVLEDLMGMRPRLGGFSEHYYLEQNPDVAAAVTNGLIPSGYFHFLVTGYNEGRRGWSLPNQIPPEEYDFPRLQARVDTLTERPLISVIVPAYETDPQLLVLCIESVRRQVYPDWELCIADDGSARPEVRDILLRYAGLDPRIKTVFLDNNQGISAASNAALALAAGSWIALLDHDDELTPDALLEIAAAINTNPTVDVIYSDEDKISVDGGRRYNPSFKPDWSPDLLKSTMYIGHLTVYRKSLVAGVSGFRSEFDGTQDYDLALRATEIASGVHHIPKILYHWRAVPGSAALDLSNKGYAIERQKTALERALMRVGARGRVRPGSIPGTWRICYATPAPHPLVSIVIPTAGFTRNMCGRDINLLRNCIQSLIDSDCYDNYEVIVVNDRPLDPALQCWLEELRQVRVVPSSEESFNFSVNVNLGVEQARGEYVLVLNDDTEVITPRFLYDMVGLASQPGVGAVGAKLLFPDARIQHNGILIISAGPAHELIGEHVSALGSLNTGQLVHNAIGVTGACLLARRDVYLAVGGFDPAFRFKYNDVDFCLKLHSRGWRVVVDPCLQLYHLESGSNLGTYAWELQKFLQRWPGLRDPFFNPNYRPDKVYFQIRQPDDDPIGDFSSCFPRRFLARRVEITEEQIRFSIIFSVYDTPVRFLNELEASLFEQSYQNFECIIVDNGSIKPETLQWLEKISESPRVKTLRFEKNAGIMAAYGAAFRAATGEYVVPVDSDDFLTLDALAILAKAIEQHDRPAALYTDECKSNAGSLLLHPFHKPDWDPVLFTNICYTCHLGCVRRDLAIAAGCYTDLKATWCHDWDTNWRLDRAGHDTVHVPEVTYAWRIHPGSMSSLEHSDKPEAPVSQKHVLTEHLRQTEWGCSLEIAENELFPHPGMWRLRPKANARLDGCVVVDLGGRTDDEVFATLSDLIFAPAAVRVIFLTSAEQSKGDRALQVALKLIAERLICVMPSDDIASALHRAVEEQGEFVVWIGRDTVPRHAGWLLETAGLLMGIGDAVLAGGRIANQENTLLWAGGFFGINGFLDSPDFGLALGDSGYHGMVHCQRSVDGVPSVHWVARVGFLSQVIERMPAGFGPGLLGAALALRAAAENKRVLYTPLNLMTTRARVVRPTVPGAQLEGVLDTLTPSTSRYYNRQLSGDPGFHWVPKYQRKEAAATSAGSN